MRTNLIHMKNIIITLDNLKIVSKILEDLLIMF